MNIDIMTDSAVGNIRTYINILFIYFQIDNDDNLKVT